MGRARKKASAERLLLEDAVLDEHVAKQKAHKEVIDALLSAAKVGLSPTKAAQLVGISPTTLKDWLEAGNGEHPTRRATPALERLARGWSKARSEFVTRQLASINEAGAGYIEEQTEETETLDRHGEPFTEKRQRRTLKRDWKAAAWLLERSEPEEYADRSRMPIDHSKFKDAFATKVIEVDRVPGRRINPSNDVTLTQEGVDRPKAMLVPHITDAPKEDRDGGRSAPTEPTLSGD